MSENNINPKIEDDVLTFLDGELKESALGFIAYLNEKQMAPRLWFGPPGYWRIPWDSYYLCGIHLKKDNWRFWFFTGDYSGEFDRNLINTVHDYVRPCVSCTTDCVFGKDTTGFGTEFVNTCYQFPIQIENPDSNTLEMVKALIEYWKGAAPNSDGWHVR